MAYLKNALEKRCDRAIVRFSDNSRLPHNSIKDKLIGLFDRSFQRDSSPYIACNDRNTVFTSEQPKIGHAWYCQNACDMLTFLLVNFFLRFCSKLYYNRQVEEIPMGTTCVLLVSYCSCFVVSFFMMSLSDDKQADIIDAFNTTSRYLGDILNIRDIYFDNMVSQIYPSGLQLNKANTSDTETLCFDFHFY